MGWVGGKSAYAATGTGKWIAGLLPPPGAAYSYIEPFAGMLGVLLQRQPARREIANDLDGDVINWWRVVRDYPAELGELLDWTPGWSAAMFEEAVANLNHEDPIYRAYYFTLALAWVRGSSIGRIRENTDNGKVDGVVARKPISHREGSADLVERKKQRKAVDGVMRRENISNREGSAERAERGKERKAGYGLDGVLSRKPIGEHDRAEYNARPDDTALNRGTGARTGSERSHGRPDDTDMNRFNARRPQGDSDGRTGVVASGGNRPPLDKPYTPPNPAYRGGEMSAPRSPAIKALADRIVGIQLETRPAEWFAEYYAGNENITWYLDPPYPSAAPKSGLYTFNSLDVDLWVELLKPIRGLVAISGYGDEWAALEDEGWMRHEHRTFSGVGARAGQYLAEQNKRVEVLWTNYDPADYDPKPSLFGGAEE